MKPAEAVTIFTLEATGLIDMVDPWMFGWDQIAGIVTPLAIIVAAFIARQGVREWRQDRLEERQAEVAAEALGLLYRAAEVFAHVRSVHGFLGEGSSRRRDPDESLDQAESRNTHFVPIERLNSHVFFFERVNDVRGPRFAALFGMKATHPLDEIVRVRNDIVTAVQI